MTRHPTPLALKILALLTLALAGLGAAPALSAPFDSGHVQVELVADQTAVAPGGMVHVALRQEIEPGWHTYWRNPGDSGQATTLAWTLPAGWYAGDIVWAPPKQLPLPAADGLRLRGRGPAAGGRSRSPPTPSRRPDRDLEGPRRLSGLRGRLRARGRGPGARPCRSRPAVRRPNPAWARTDRRRPGRCAEARGPDRRHVTPADAAQAQHHRRRRSRA